MPTPARTSIDAIVAAGRSILEAEGLDGLTMQRVAAAVGVRAPSLYKRVRGREDLVRLIANDVAAELTAVARGRRDDAATRASTCARSRARSAPSLSPTPRPTACCSTGCPKAARVDPEVNARAAAALLRTAAELAGPERTPSRPPGRSSPGPTAS